MASDNYRNISIIKWYSFLSQLWPLSPFIIIYLQQITGSFILATSIYALCNFTQFLFEVPSGIFADKISKNKVLSIASLCMLSCFILWAIAGHYHYIPLLYIASICYGLSVSFQSGTIDAYIYENTIDKDHSDFAKIYAKSNEYAQLGLCASALLATVITYFYSLKILVWINIIPAFIRVAISFLLSNTNNHFSKKKYSISMLNLVRVFLKNKRLFFFSSMRILDYSVDLALHRFEPTYFVLLVPKYMISFFTFIKQLCGAIGFKIIQKINKFNKVNTYFQILLASCGFRVAFVMLNNMLTPFFMAIANIFHGPAITMNSYYLQSEFISKKRASMMSIISLFSSLFYAFIMCILGLLAEYISLQSTILFILLLKILSIIIARIYYKKKIDIQQF